MHRGSNKETTCGLLDFLILAAKLKTTKRTGWVDSNIKNPESISDHMHRMGLISLLIPQSENIINGFNRDRLVKMAIVHDLAECIVGDLTPHCGVTSKDKHQMESDAMELIVGICENSQLVREVKELWVEYESGVTETAKICKFLCIQCLANCCSCSKFYIPIIDN